MRYSIMTEKIARRGVPVARGYEVDHLRQQLVRPWATSPAVTLAGDETLAAVRERLQHEASERLPQGFPVIDGSGRLIGVVTRRDLFRNGAAAESTVRTAVRRPPVVIYEDSTLREAADQMVQHRVGRLPVVAREAPERIVGIITRSDLLMAHAGRLDELHTRDEPILRVRRRGVS
jgi:CBS domain-containing protein